MTNSRATSTTMMTAVWKGYNLVMNFFTDVEENIILIVHNRFIYIFVL